MRKLFYLIVCTSIFFNCTTTTTKKKVYETIGYIQKIEDAFDTYVNPNTKIEIISKGYIWTEGPLWLKEEQALIFSDVVANTAYKWTEKDSISVFLSPSGYTQEGKGQGSNGLFLDKKGNIVLCQTGDRKVAALEQISTQGANPQYKTLAETFEGKRFNAPNDLVIDSNNTIYFTDPNFGLSPETAKELDFQGVFKINKEGNVQLLTKKWPTPNGIHISPDEKTLYIANSEPALLIAYDITEEGTLIKERILFDMQTMLTNSVAKQKPDGMAIKKDGTIFLAGPDGVLVLTPEGKHLGTIRTDKLTANCVFNEDESVLYITCHQLILRVQLKP